MSHGNTNDLIDRGTELSSTLRNDAVFVVSECRVDANHVSTLLSESGYRSEWIANSPSPSNNAGYLDTANQYLATVVCHRKSTTCHPWLPPRCLHSKKIIVLSDCESEDTVVSLLNNGAQYFFNLCESNELLQARLEAALRQNRQFTRRSFAVGELYFDAEKRVVARQGIVVDLSPKEFDLAYYLFFNRDRMVCNSELLISIWSLPANMDTRRIDTAACQLRKKLKLDSEHGWILKRLRTIGYRLVPVDSVSYLDTPCSKLLSTATG